MCVALGAAAAAASAFGITFSGNDWLWKKYTTEPATKDAAPMIREASTADPRALIADVSTMPL
jgi:hypothetical protein